VKQRVGVCEVVVVDAHGFGAAGGDPLVNLSAQGGLPALAAAERGRGEHGDYDGSAHAGEYILGVIVSKRVRLHYHRPDRGTTVFEEQLLIDRPDVKVTLLADYPGRDSYAADRLILSAGAPIVWFVFPALWRDVGRFHLADGTFTGWYTNLRAPVRFDGDDWYCTDLFLDHWLPVSGPAAWLDQDELDAAVRAGLLDGITQERIAAERATVDDLLARGNWPPAITREIDLAEARRRLGAAESPTSNIQSPTQNG
jgi:predicted RNA-binding protein associated with RNAse of E/G family